MCLNDVYAGRFAEKVLSRQRTWSYHYEAVGGEYGGSIHLRSKVFELTVFIVQSKKVFS